MTAERKRRITVPLVDRANYGRMKPVLAALQQHPDLELQVICTGSMVLERFGEPALDVKRDGFPIRSTIYIEVEGSLPSTMAKSLGMGVIEFASELQRLDPDIVLCIGDRYEMLAAVVAASCMNICIAHIQGGEVSGSIDECIRHATTKFSHYHFAATRRAADYLIRMGEPPEHVFHVGCPSSDVARINSVKLSSDVVNSTGQGAHIDVTQPYLLVIYHPVTTEFGYETHGVEHILEAVSRVQMPTLWLWPNIDAGSDHVSKTLRLYYETAKPAWLRLAKTFSPEMYAKILDRAAVAIGNSSSFVRDSSFYGTPVILVGGRQRGRECSDNVTCVDEDADRIYEMMQEKLSNGRYAPSTLYGDGYVAARIAAKLAEVPLYVQKQLDYVNQ